MSQTDPFDPALSALLKADRAPALSPDFADRVVAAAEERTAGLPPLRRPRTARWRMVRRVALGVGAGLLLSSAAAATGVLEQVGITLPQPVQHFVDRTVATVTGRPVVTRREAQPAPVVAAPVAVPEQLDQALARIDEAHTARRDQRRAVVDQRIDRELERRRAAGLPVPSAEQEAVLRQRLEQTRARRDAVAEQQRAAVRAELQQAVAEGQAITRETIRQAREDAGAPALTPAQRQAQRQVLRRRLAERRGLATVAPEATPAENLP